MGSCRPLLGARWRRLLLTPPPQPPVYASLRDRPWTLCAWRSGSRRSAASLIVRSRFDDPVVPECNFAQKVMQKWTTYGGKTALVEVGSQRLVTYAQLYDQVRRVASGLRRLGVKANDVVCMNSHNTLEYPVVFFAIIAIGAVPTPVNPLSTAGELHNTLKASRARFIYCAAHTLPVVQEAIADLPTAVKFKVIADDRPVSAASNVLPISVLMDDDGTYFDGYFVPENCKDTTACLPFSSGTTGLPKGVMLTHYNLTANFIQIWREPIFPIGQGDTLAGVLPFFHAYGMSVLLTTGLHSGAKIAVYPKWDPVLFLSAIRDHRINVLPLVPPMILFMAKELSTSKYDLSSMEHVTSAAAPLGIQLSEEFLRKFPQVKTLRQAYGLTESGPGSHAETRTRPRTGSCGELLPGVEARVINVDTGVDCGPRNEGEILLRGPNIMKGYFENSEATASAFQDGWLKTGDIGYYDEDGFFFIVDRVKELIKYKAAQVAPAELEAILLSHPAVRDAAVIGVPDEKSGELPRAYVCLKHGASASAEQLVEFVAGQVSPYKRLRGGVRFVSEIPKASTGKLLRRVLKEQAVKEQ